MRVSGDIWPAPGEVSAKKSLGVGELTFVRKITSSYTVQGILKNKIVSNNKCM